MATHLRTVLMVVLLVCQSSMMLAAECRPLKTSGSKCAQNTHAKPNTERRHAPQPNVSVVIILPATSASSEPKKTDPPKSSDKESAEIMGMKTENFIQTLVLVTAIFAFAIAAMQFKHLKNLEANKLTLELWKQYLSDFGKLRSALLTMKKPMNTSPTDFTNIQSIRNWIDGVATLGTHSDLINNNLIKEFGLDGPINNFMTLLQQSTDELQRLSILGVPRAQDLFRKYQGEIDSSDNIFKWLKTL